MESHACTGKFHAGGSAYTSLPVCLDHLFFARPSICNALFLFLLRYFHMYKPQTNLVHVCVQLISLRNEHFLVTPSMCRVFISTNSRHTLQTSLCPAFYWRKQCHDRTFNLLFFHMYKLQSNFNSRQRRKFTVAARKTKLIELSFKSCRA